MGRHEVKVQRTFIHPLFFGDNTQEPGLFFSDDLEYMLEFINDKRITLYKWGTQSNEWQIVRKLDNYEKEMNGSTSYPVPMTPDFKHFLDFDHKHHTFMIRDTITENIEYHVPQHLLALEEGDTLKSYMNRFHWKSATEFIIIDRDGVERVIDYNPDTDTAKEVGFGLLPYFKVEDTVDHHFHYNQKFY